MNSNTASANGQTSHATFDPTDEGQREAWSLLLAGYRWDCFATLTFKSPRRDPYEIVKAFDLWLYRWHVTEATAHGQATTHRKPRQDAYGRALPDRVKRVGPFINAWKRDKDGGRVRPVYVLGIEPHKSGDLHLHAIVKFNTTWEMQRCVGWRTWADPEYDNGMNMGWARLEPPKSQGDVRGYCSKYVTKGGELVLSRSFNARCGHANTPRTLLATA